MKNIVFIIQFIVIGIMAVDAQSVDLQVSQDTVMQGEFFQVSLTVSDIKGQFDNDILDLSAFTVVGQSTSSSMNFREGEMHSSHMYSYTVRADESGTFIIPSVDIDTEGDALHIDEISIVVLPREDWAVPPSFDQGRKRKIEIEESKKNSEPIRKMKRI